MKVIILSAGQGRRLLPLTESTPKAALPIGPRRVLEWQLHEIARTAVDEVVVVTGFGAEHIERIAAAERGVPTRTLYNPFYASCDNLGTCWVARHEMEGDFVIINGDTLFEAAILERLLGARGRAPITLVTDSKASYDDDDMKVVVAEGLLRRVGKQLDRATVNGESIGMMHFDARGGARFREQVEFMMRHGSGLKQWYLSAIDALAAEAVVTTCPIDGLSWGEIDDHRDLERAARLVAAWQTTAPAAASAGA
ncbi:MAG: phosphocholine cytidylyltransferase family protein [Gammaproteobacteria bacterium]